MIISSNGLVTIESAATSTTVDLDGFTYRYFQEEPVVTAVAYSGPSNKHSQHIQSILNDQFSNHNGDMDFRILPPEYMIAHIAFYAGNSAIFKHGFSAESKKVNPWTAD